MIYFTTISTDWNFVSTMKWLLFKKQNHKIICNKDLEPMQYFLLITYNTMTAIQIKEALKDFWRNDKESWPGEF